MASLILISWSARSMACDDLIDNILSTQIKPAIEDLDCAVLKKGGVDKKGHRLNGVCYESFGPTSRVKIDTSLNCHTSNRAVVHVSISENVSAVAEVRGSDCQVTGVHINPSGELGKALAAMFNANGKAHVALQKGLIQACHK